MRATFLALKKCHWYFTNNIHLHDSTKQTYQFSEKQWCADPIDRMILTQAISENINIVSSDEIFEEFLKSI